MTWSITYKLTRQAPEAAAVKAGSSDSAWRAFSAWRAETGLLDYYQATATREAAL